MKIFRVLSILFCGCALSLVSGCSGGVDEEEQAAGIEEAQESPEYQQYNNMGRGGPQGPGAGGPGAGHGR